MGYGRIPGLYGNNGVYGCIYSAGPLGTTNESHFGNFPHVTPGAMGTGQDLAARVAQTVDEETPDEAELKLLVKTYGKVMNKAGKLSYSTKVKKKVTYHVAEYVSDRNALFGATSYADYLDKCRAELNADDAKLRKYIEPNPETRKKVPNWARGQDVFYAWVRKAYEQVLGDGVDVPTLIKSQTSATLKSALEKVKHDFPDLGSKFRYGGFNPRPMKLDGGYRLGTISEHALGMAIDIAANDNPQLKKIQWEALLNFTGKTVDRSKATWKATPKTMYEAVQAVNSAWLTKIASALKSAEVDVKKLAESAAPPSPAGAKTKALPTAIEIAMKANPALAVLGAAFVREYEKKGIISLPWELVSALHEAGFIWGVTFPDIDIMHFEVS